MDEKTIANIIVDLYEMRVSTMHKYQGTYEKIHDMSKYNFFTSAIAQIWNKYKVSEELVDEIVRERHRKTKFERDIKDGLITFEDKMNV